MTVKDVENSINELKRQGWNEEEILRAFYAMFQDNKINLDELEALCDVLGYKLTEEFLNMSPEDQKTKGISDEEDEQSNQSSVFDDYTDDIKYLVFETEIEGCNEITSFDVEHSIISFFCNPTTNKRRDAYKWEYTSHIDTFPFLISQIARTIGYIDENNNHRGPELKVTLITYNDEKIEKIIDGPYLVFNSIVEKDIEKVDLLKNIRILLPKVFNVPKCFYYKNEIKSSHRKKY